MFHLAQAIISSSDIACETLLCKFIESGDEGRGAARTLAESETSSARLDTEAERTIEMDRKKERDSEENIRKEMLRPAKE